MELAATPVPGISYYFSQGMIANPCLRSRGIDQPACRTIAGVSGQHKLHNTLPIDMDWALFIRDLRTHVDWTEQRDVRFGCGLAVPWISGCCQCGLVSPSCGGRVGCRRL